MASELFEADWRYVLDTVYQLDSVSEFDRFRPKVLSCLRYAIPFCQGMFYIYDLKDGDFCQDGPPTIIGDEARYLDEFDRKYSHETFFGGVSVISQSRVFRDTDMMPDEVRMRTAWYREIYVKQGIHYALRCYLAYGGVLIGSIDLFRPRDGNDFSDKEVAMLGLLARHISLKLKVLLDRRELSGAPSKVWLTLVARYGLTTREGEVIREIFMGGSDSDIANRLCISTSTFKKHVHNAYRKLGVNNRSRLFALLQSIESE